MSTAPPPRCTHDPDRRRDIAHVGPVELHTPVLEESRDFFVDVLALREVHRDATGRTTDVPGLGEVFLFEDPDGHELGLYWDVDWYRGGRRGASRPSRRSTRTGPPSWRTHDHRLPRPLHDRAGRAHRLAGGAAGRVRGR